MEVIGVLSERGVETRYLRLVVERLAPRQTAPIEQHQQRRDAIRVSASSCYPPLTGGIRAISSRSCSAVSSAAYSLLTATARLVRRARAGYWACRACSRPWADWPSGAETSSVAAPRFRGQCRTKLFSGSWAYQDNSRNITVEQTQTTAPVLRFLTRRTLALVSRRLPDFSVFSSPLLPHCPPFATAAAAPSVLFDNHGRPLEYLRLAVTDRCNLRCFYCMPEEGIKYLPKQELLTYEEMERLVAMHGRAGRAQSAPDRRGALRAPRPGAVHGPPEPDSGHRGADHDHQRRAHRPPRSRAGPHRREGREPEPRHPRPGPLRQHHPPRRAAPGAGHALRPAGGRHPGENQRRGDGWAEHPGPAAPGRADPRAARRRALHRGNALQRRQPRGHARHAALEPPPHPRAPGPEPGRA